MPRTLIGPYLITTSPSITNCRSCGAVVMAVCVGGIDRHVGSEGLTPAGELAAVMAGRATYEVHTDLLIERDPLRLRSRFPVREPVVADHACTGFPPGSVDPAASETIVLLAIRTMGGSLADPRIDPPF